jgi:hypothetical protein
MRETKMPFGFVDCEDDGMGWSLYIVVFGWRSEGMRSIILARDYSRLIRVWCPDVWLVQT